jgi:hypothetical protein
MNLNKGSTVIYRHEDMEGGGRQYGKSDKRVVESKKRAHEFARSCSINMKT